MALLVDVMADLAVGVTGRVLQYLPDAGALPSSRLIGMIVARLIDWPSVGRTLEYPKSCRCTCRPSWSFSSSSTCPVWSADGLELIVAGVNRRAK